MKERPNCGTFKCKEIALGLFSGKWRCGKCIKRYSEKLREQGEALFIQE